MFCIREENTHTRRAFLRVGAFGLGVLGLPALLHGNPVDKPWVRGKSVVWLWLGGGPPQAETWDPKPDAPDGVRTMFGTVKTSLPGIAFGSHFPKLAERANRLTVVRSFQTPCKDHQENWVRTMLTGTESKPSPPSAGSVYSFLRGTNHPKTGMPSYILLDSGNNEGISPRALPPREHTRRPARGLCPIQSGRCRRPAAEVDRPTTKGGSRGHFLTAPAEHGVAAPSRPRGRSAGTA